ncbi:MAG: hypothetical protein ACI9NQ_000859 [Paracoccaceae bacterium]
MIVKDCLDPLDQQIILDGLSDLMRRRQKAHGKDIGQLSGDEQVAFLTYMALTA